MELIIRAYYARGDLGTEPYSLLMAVAYFLGEKYEELKLDNVLFVE